MSRTTFTTIMYGLEDVSATVDGVFSSTNFQPFTSFSQLLNDSNIITPVQTNEPNLSLLGGNMKVLDTNGSQQYGYWSLDMTDEDGNFETNPKLTRVFENYHSTPSIIFYFHEDNRPKKIRVKFFRDNTLLSDSTFNVDNAIYNAKKSAKDYNKFEIEFIGTHIPNRYVKLAEIFYGEYLIWDRENIIDATVVEEFNLISDELPIGQLEFSIFDEHDDFNILNPTGMYSSLQQKQKILVTETIDNVEYDYGTYYLDTWENTQGKIASFIAKDALGLLDDVTYKNSKMYNNEPIYNVIGDIMDKANFGNYVIENSLSGKTLSGYIPICTCREALQYVCMATNSCAFCTRDGFLRIRKMPLDTTVIDMNKTRKWGTKVTQNDIVNSVLVEGYSFTLSEESSELFKNTLEKGTYEIDLTEPATNLQVSDNVTVNESNINFVNFTVDSAGEVIINGNKFIKNSNIVLKESSGIIRKRQVELKDNFLIGFDNSIEIANHIYNYYQRRLIETFTFINELEKLGENVKMELELGQEKNGTITKMETNLTGGFLTEATVVNEV